jgi:hypothetical protein
VFLKTSKALRTDLIVKSRVKLRVPSGLKIVRENFRRPSGTRVDFPLSLGAKSAGLTLLGVGAPVASQ